MLESSEKKAGVTWEIVIDTNQYKEFETFCQHNKGFSCEILSRQFVYQDATPAEEKPTETVVEEKPCSTEEQPAEVKSYTSFKFKCSTCEAGFEQPTEHREHFRSDWHRYNLKRKNRNLPIMNEAEYNSLDEADRELFLMQDSIATFYVFYQ